MACPECGSPISASATSCTCGWTKARRAPGTALHPMHGSCRVAECGARLDGDDRLCGYHRALQGGDLEAWKASQRNWREDFFREFRERHQGDIWGSLCNASLDLRTNEDRRELLQHLKRLLPNFTKLPYDPRQREAA